MSTLRTPSNQPFPSLLPDSPLTALHAGNLRLRTPEDIRALGLELIRTPKHLDHDYSTPIELPTARPSTKPAKPKPTAPNTARAPVPRIDPDTPLEDIVFDFLDPSMKLDDLCCKCELTPIQLEALLDSPKAQRIFESIERLKARRAEVIARHARAEAQATLARIAQSPTARPETQRKAANALINLHNAAPRASTHSRVPTPEQADRAGDHPSTQHPPLKQSAHTHAHTTDPHSTLPLRHSAISLPSQNVSVTSQPPSFFHPSPISNAEQTIAFAIGSIDGENRALDGARVPDGFHFNKRLDPPGVGAALGVVPVEGSRGGLCDGAG